MIQDVMMVPVRALVCTLCQGTICTSCEVTPDGELVAGSECAGHFLHEPGECPYRSRPSEAPS